MFTDNNIKYNIVLILVTLYNLYCEAIKIESLPDNLEIQLVRLCILFCFYCNFESKYRCLLPISDWNL